MATKRRVNTYRISGSVTRVGATRKRKSAKRKAVKKVVRRKTTHKKQAPLRRIKAPANSTIVIEL